METTPLKKALNADGRRQSWLADRLSVTPETVCRWASGKYLPPKLKRKKIAELLGRKESELFFSESDYHLANGSEKER